MKVLNRFWSVIALAVACGCRPSTPSASSKAVPLPTLSVRTERVEAREEVLTEEVVGTVRPKLSAWLAAKVSGRIETIAVAPGDSVASGQTLVALDQKEPQARLLQAEAVLAQTKNDLNRYQTLLADDAVTRAEFDAVEARARVAEAALDEAKAALAQTHLVAPFAGVVTRKLVDVGDLASPGRPLLGLEDPRQLRLEADIAEALIENVTIGTTCRVHVAAVGADLAGVVREVAPTADASSRTIPIKLDLPPSRGLRSGLFGRVSIPAGRAQVIWIPLSALREQGQLSEVFVVRDGVASLRLIRTGRRQQRQVEVISGLAAGESVVVEGVEPLRDGQPVQVRS